MRRRASERNRRAPGRDAEPEAEIHRRLRWARDPPRRHAGWRIGGRLRHVRRAERPPAGFRRRARARRLVDGDFSGSLCRLCGGRRRGRGACARGRRIRRGRRSGLALCPRACALRRSGLPRSPYDEATALVDPRYGDRRPRGRRCRRAADADHPAGRAAAGEHPVEAGETERETEGRGQTGGEGRRQTARAEEVDRRAGRSRPRRRPPTRRKTRWCSSPSRRRKSPRRR